MAACTTDGTTPGVTAANPADAKVQPPLDEHQASAGCWMKYDSSKMSLEQKSAAVDKCIDETMRAQKR